MQSASIIPDHLAGVTVSGGELTDDDWVRAIRHGIRRDGTSLLIMPSYAYANLSDRDLGAMVAYLKRLPPVDNATALASWDEDDFFRAMRQGRRPDGTEITDFMPWRVMGAMTDEELTAIWLYLQSAGSD